MTYTDPPFDPEDYEGIVEKKRAVPTSQIKKWEAESRRLHELEEKFEVAQREQVFSAAGVPTDGAGVWFRKGYDGEATVEAVRAALEQSGILGSAQSQRDSLAGHSAARDLGAGATRATVSGADAEFAALRAKSLKKKNGVDGFADEKAELDALLQREGVNPAADREYRDSWRVPGQLMG